MSESDLDWLASIGADDDVIEAHLEGERKLCGWEERNFDLARLERSARRDTKLTEAIETGERDDDPDLRVARPRPGGMDHRVRQAHSDHLEGGDLGRGEEQPEWFGLVAFGTIAEALVQHGRGDMAAISGRLTKPAWKGG